MRPDPDAMGPDAGRVVDLLSSMTPDDATRDEPPTDLWDRIASQISTADQPKVLAQPSELRVVATSDEDPDGRDLLAASAPAAGGNVVDMDSRRRQRWFRVAAAAAVVVIAAGTYGVISANGPERTEVVASVGLEPLKDSGSGTAELISVDGAEQLRITAEGLPDAPDGHHYELWLIDSDVTDPRSLGRLRSGQDEVVVDVPEGVDPDAYPIVDINLQVDGEVQHSGVDTSVLRGSLA